jgi:hypothetical protein
LALCKRLPSSPSPPGTGWRSLPWVVARCQRDVLAALGGSDLCALLSRPGSIAIEDERDVDVGA